MLISLIENAIERILILLYNRKKSEQLRLSVKTFS